MAAVSPFLFIQDVQLEYSYFIKSNRLLCSLDENKLVKILRCQAGKWRESCIKRLEQEIHQPDDGQLSSSYVLIEVGPRFNLVTAWSTNTVSILHAAGLDCIERVERSRRYWILFQSCTNPISEVHLHRIADVLHDRMTEYRYSSDIQTCLDIKAKIQPFYEIDVIGQGSLAIENANEELGLALDQWDIEYYTRLFVQRLGRNPTNVELFDLSQSNSEHSRHWFFKGKLIVDDVGVEKSLMKMIQETQNTSAGNNVIQFHDNSSAIRGYNVDVLMANQPFTASGLSRSSCCRHITYTAETHNFPTGVAPFEGASTGTGGRIRDVQATGRGAHVIAATVGYSFGSLHIPGYKLPWEDETDCYPANYASPLEIAIQASNGASNYGNQFGEPVICGFTRSMAVNLRYKGKNEPERQEYIKPIMFSGGIGSIDDGHINKLPPQSGLQVVKIGGPAYRIGMGGGSASSRSAHGNDHIDTSAVQRGDAEMGQKLNRVVRGCIELGQANPIWSIHDQGAGGNGNVLKEIVNPQGARICLSKFITGDTTLSALEIWCAEYQESNALLTSKPHIIEEICKREKLPMAIVGEVTDDGYITLVDDRQFLDYNLQQEHSYPVHLKLDHILDLVPQKIFKLKSMQLELLPLTLTEQPVIASILERILRLPSVGSKRFLTNKVDRSVSGLVAQQQCVGPLHTPLADVGVVALSHFNIVGSAIAIGEQPFKILIDPAAGARLTVGEALTNLAFAQLSSLKDVKCSANWMWPAKMNGEGARLYQACRAMCEMMKSLEIAVDGGKDSLSMATMVDGTMVKSPGTLVISMYCNCSNITNTLTPNLKAFNGQNNLIYINLSRGKYRLGGSAFAQAFQQIGDAVPDIEDVQHFKRAFNQLQILIKNKLCTAGHDISDGGLITTLLEMAFAGNCGLTVDISSLMNRHHTIIETLFAEELGFVIEVTAEKTMYVVDRLRENNIQHYIIGSSTTEKLISISNHNDIILSMKMPILRDMWEETSFQLDKLQANPVCVESERWYLLQSLEPNYYLSFTPISVNDAITWPLLPTSLRVAVIREEGSNGDREMAAALHLVGFEVWDIVTSDLCKDHISLDRFCGVVFVGGFSYADVLGSARGWAAAIGWNDIIRRKLIAFKQRQETFSLGICNGCQLMAHLGWIGMGTDQVMTSNHFEIDGINTMMFTHNTSGRFESRFPTVKIFDSPSIMLQGMTHSQLGIWIAHAEGNAKFSSNQALQEIVESNLAPIRYVDECGQPTERYPLNPNGSPYGIAGICSSDGRHLAMMPHPERCIQLWQWPWLPQEWKETVHVSPWLKMFRNAYDWCISKCAVDGLS